MLAGERAAKGRLSAQLRPVGRKASVGPCRVRQGLFALARAFGSMAIRFVRELLLVYAQERSRCPALRHRSAFIATDSETACAVSPRESALLLQPYRFLGYASLEDNGAIEIRDLDCIRRAERLAIRTHADAA